MIPLHERRFVVVGAGGVGGQLLTGLVKLLEYQVPGATLVIVDGDSFEPKNRERQEFTVLGNKAEVRAQELQLQCQSTMILPVPKWVVADDYGHGARRSDDDELDEWDTKITASKLLRNGDVVFAVVDNFAARKLLFDAAKAHDHIDVFTGGNDDAYYGSVQRYARRAGVDILEDPMFRHDEYANPPDRNPGEMNCAERAQLQGGGQLLATNMAVAAFLLARVHKTLIADEDDAEAEIYFDLGKGLATAADRRESSTAVVPA